MAIFIKLFATNMVAKSFFGFSRSDVIMLMLFVCSALAVSISDFVKENKATSTPEINAEQNSNTARAIKLTKKEVFMVIKGIRKLLGSGSKAKRFFKKS